MLYWTGVVEGDDPGARIRFGRGGLDPILASGHDLSSCAAISERAFDRLIARGAIAGAADFPRAVALLARSPGADSLECEGLVSRIDFGAAGAAGVPSGSAAHADAITLSVFLPSPEVAVEPFFAALKGQAVSGQLDVLILTVGFGAQALKTLARQIDSAAAADPRFKPRRYSLAEGPPPAYLANMAVGLANTEAVVLADARCLPVSPGAVQQLANWVVSGDTVSASPRILFEGRLLAAGLALTRQEDEESVAPWSDPLLSDVVRTAAAPAPWFFALRRSAWLTAGGLRGETGADLWSAEFAYGHGPRGRSFLVGGELAEWTGPTRPASLDAAAPAHRRLQPSAQLALRDPRPLDVAISTAPPQREVDGRGQPGAEARFSDRFPNEAEHRLLVFADAFAASQSIAFVQGLAAGRAAGRAAVRIVEESAFPGDSRTLDEVDAAEAVARHFEETRPTVVVVSRLGHAAVWKAVSAAARRAGTPVLCHIDDDILDLPVVLGLERYRLARGPKRSRTLRETVKAADLVLAATAPLAERMRAEAGHDRIFAFSQGAAGRPPQPRLPVPERPDLVIGYMGSASHDHDLALAVPALNRISAAYPFVRIVLFGSIAEQDAARGLVGRIERHGPVQGDYAAFRRRLADLAIDVGLAPLNPIAFNQVKTATKWAEYAEAGAAVLASPTGPYRPLIAAEAALGVGPDDWELALRRVIEHPPLRRRLVEKADAVLLERFGWEQLEGEMLEALAEISKLKRQAA
jgi:glycosyltransferase involved in cell wall biosynthesis